MNLKDFFEIIEYNFEDEELAKEALTHPSFNKESNYKKNYQRLEFLGDKVLSLVISDFLIAKYPKENEGDMSKRHANLVCGSVLSEIALKLKIDKYIILSSSEKKSGGRNNKRNLENCVEAIIGAIYKDSGYNQAKQFILRFWEYYFEKNILPPKDPVSKLQEIIQNSVKKLPEYEFQKVGGSDHAPEFEAKIKIEDFEINVSGFGKSKKEAQKIAAQKALLEIESKK